MDNHEWIKLRLMVGTQTKIVMSVDIRGWTANDTTYFVPLVERAAENFRGREVAADMAYPSRKNLNAVETASAMPFIPFKSNTLEPTEVGTDVPPVHAQTR
jgi:hypothetical protein